MTLQTAVQTLLNEHANNLVFPFKYTGMPVAQESAPCPMQKRIAPCCSVFHPSCSLRGSHQVAGVTPMIQPALAEAGRQEQAEGQAARTPAVLALPERQAKARGEWPGHRAKEQAETPVRAATPDRPGRQEREAPQGAPERQEWAGSEVRERQGRGTSPGRAATPGEGRLVMRAVAAPR